MIERQVIIGTYSGHPPITSLVINYGIQADLNGQHFQVSLALWMENEVVISLLGDLRREFLQLFL